jgi:hypothetical protein
MAKNVTLEAEGIYITQTQQRWHQNLLPEQSCLSSGSLSLGNFTREQVSLPLQEKLVGLSSVGQFGSLWLLSQSRFVLPAQIEHLPEKNSSSLGKKEAKGAPGNQMEKG